VNSDDGGIGGTGISADVDLGIVGLITGFASICVNGVEVSYDTQTQVTVNGVPASTEALAVGQVVAVRAHGNSLLARAHSIAVLDAVIGPIGAFDRSANALEVRGQQVRLTASTIVGPGVREAREGESVRVSGLRAADGSIAATRIERAPAGATWLRDERSYAPALAAERFLLQGYVSAGRELRIGEVGVSASDAVRSRLASEGLVIASGRTAADGRHVVERVQTFERSLPERREGATPGENERGRGGRGERTERPDPSGPSERTERPATADRPERVERPERLERSGPDRPERVERPDRSGSNSGRN
jgi:hypothetical protein